MIPDINLMPKIEKGETSSKFAFILIGILTFTTSLILVWMFFDAKGELSSAEAARDSLVVTRDTLQQEMNSYETLNQGSLEESVTFVERVSYPVTPIIDEMRNLLPQYTYLRSYEFSELGGQVEVDFETLNAVSSYINSLENSLFFEDIQVGAIQNFELTPSNEEKDVEHQFTEVPRYTVEINFIINRTHVAAGGDR